MLVFIAASLLAVAAWLYLLAARGGYWRTDQRLPPVPADQAAPPGATAWPAVVAVVPARDEAEILPETLPTLLAQQYPGRLTVVLVDDESSDGTAEIAGKLGSQAPRDDPRPGEWLLIVPGQPTPPGWAGKVWAMEQGLRAAPAADFVLFTDADIAYAPGTLLALVRAAQAGDLAIVSQMALLRSDSSWERLLIPAFVYFFAQLYPFRMVNRRTVAAAAGGCMLVRREALEAAGGLDRIRGARIDDVALAGLLKRAHGACWLGFSTQVTSRRRYDGLAEIWDMVARNAYTQLRYSPAALAGTVLGMSWLYLLPVAAALAGLAMLADPVLAGAGASSQSAAWLGAAGLAAWAIMSVTYLPVLRLSQLSALRAPCLPLIGLLYTAMTITSALRHRAGRETEWKGRMIPT